jgi:threonine aldolase
MSFDLHLARKPTNPVLLLHDLAERCVELGINRSDVYGDNTLDSSSSWLRKFEKEVCEYLCMQDAVFLPSGVMAQNIVLAVSAEASDSTSFVCHYSSHLLIHEKNAYERLLKLDALVVPPNEGAMSQQPFSFSDLMEIVDKYPSAKPCVVFIECPHREIGGKITSWEDLVQMSSFCRSNKIRIHMDGARLWEASAAYSKPLSELCSLFDSIYVSFYKGLGGITGAMLLGTTSFIDESRVWLRRFGGNVFSLLPYAVSAWHGFRENKDLFTARKNCMVAVVSAVTENVLVPSCDANKPDSWLVRFDPPVPTVSLIHVYLNADVVTATAAVNDAAARSGIRCCAMVRAGNHGAVGQSYFEFNMVRFSAYFPVLL